MKTLKQQYAQQVRRIKQNIKRMESKGFIIPESILPQKPKRITQATIRRLKAITTKVIAQKSTYGGAETQGEVVTGIRGFRLEQRASYMRGVETKRKRAKLSSITRTKSIAEARPKRRQTQVYDTTQDVVQPDETYEYEQGEGGSDFYGGADEDHHQREIDEATERVRQRKREEYERFERERRQRDKEERERMEREQARRQQFSEGRMKLQGVKDVIAGATKGESFAAHEMQTILDEALDDLGEEQLCVNLSEVTEDVIEEANLVLKYRPNSEGYMRHLKAFYIMIWGKAMSGYEAQEYSDRAEKHAMYVNNPEDWNDRSDVGTAGTKDFD